MDMQIILKKLNEIIARLDKIVEQMESVFHPSWVVVPNIHSYPTILTKATLHKIDDNTPGCNCTQHNDWHWCDFHGWCNPVSQVGV